MPSPYSASVEILRPCVILVVFVLSALPGSVEASNDEEGQQTQRNYSRFYNGAFTEYSVRGGPNFSSADTYGGWHLDVGFRQSLPMHIVDARLAYQFDGLTSRGDELPGKMDLHGLGLHAKLHPFYLALLGSDWLSYIAASLHVDVGIGGQYGILDPGAGGEVETDLGFVWSVGGGFDVPLWDPDAGQAMWLNVLYSFRKSDFDRPSQAVELPLHMVFVGLGWRVNGLLW